MAFEMKRKEEEKEQEEKKEEELIRKLDEEGEKINEEMGYVRTVLKRLVAPSGELRDLQNLLKGPFLSIAVNPNAIPKRECIQRLIESLNKQQEDIQRMIKFLNAKQEDIQSLIKSLNAVQEDIQRMINVLNDYASYTIGGNGGYYRRYIYNNK